MTDARYPLWSEEPAYRDLPAGESDQADDIIRLIGA